MLEKMTDLELAEVLNQQYQQVIAGQNNIMAIQKEIERRQQTKAVTQQPVAGAQKPAINS